MTEKTLTNEELLTLFTSGAEKLQAVTRNLSEAELDLSCGSDDWTIRQIIPHVTDDCDVWSMCLKKAIATPGALVRFEGFPGNEVAATD